jgi:hypothetical protein
MNRVMYGNPPDTQEETKENYYYEDKLRERGADRYGFFRVEFKEIVK